MIEVPGGKFAGYAVVVDPGYVGGRARGRYVVTAERQARRLALVDFPTPVAALTRLRVPEDFNGRNPQMRRDLASALRTAHPRPGAAAAERGGRRRRAPASPRHERRGRPAARRSCATHPCHDCPDREDHARWAERWFKLDRDARTLRRRVEQRTNTVARQFDRVCEVLTALGYLDGRRRSPTSGAHADADLLRLDLVAAEALRTGRAATASTPSGLAAALSVLVFEARRPDDASRRGCPAARSQRGDRASWCGCGGELARAGARAPARLPAPARRRASRGRRTAGPRATTSTTCSARADLAAGDFVRWMKQLIDLAGQVADAAGAGPLRDTARDVVRRAAARRGGLLGRRGLRRTLDRRESVGPHHEQVLLGPCCCRAAPHPVGHQSLPLRRPP